MAAPKVYVDGQLIAWGERLFYSPLRKARVVDDPARSAKKVLPRDTKRAAYVRAAIDRTLRRSPEVMVKITSKRDAGRGMSRIRPHLEYISRNGKLELEDQDGNIIAGWPELKDLEQHWQEGLGIPENSTRREAFNLLFSMPPGTDELILKEAVKAVAHSEFHAHRYVMAVHNDTDQTHIHVCLQAKNKHGKYLNPRKADLARWRENFAQELRDRGLEANATPRKTRGVTKQYLKQETLHQRRRQPAEFPERQRSEEELLKSHRPQLLAWAQCMQSLGESEDPEDKRLAEQINRFSGDMPVVKEIESSKKKLKTRDTSKPDKPERSKR